MEKKNLICSYPWHSFSVENENYNLCCAAKRGPVKIRDMNLYDFFYNSEYMKEVRETMLLGEWHPDCELCKQQEENGLKSLRLKNKNTISDQPVLTYLDLRFSNKCNLGCRMCNEDFSSVIAEEKGIKVKYDWSNIVFDQIDRLSTVNKIYITGGEPLLVKDNYKLLQNFCDRKLTRIDIDLNTNCTIFSDKFIELLVKFRTVHVNLSIDGVGKVQEYIRWPSKWAVVESVFFKWLELSKKYPNIRLRLTPVIQLLNAPYIDEYINYFSKYTEVKIIPIILDQPDYFDLAHSPEQVWDVIDTQEINNIEIKNMIERKREARVKDFWFDHGKIFLQNQDKLRKINIEDYQPYFGFLK
jgi:uncharacterized radical SAM superfamily Fe-S cluster-containing enzyme